MKFAFQICIFLIATTSEYPIVLRSKKEKRFIDPLTAQSQLFPSIEDDASVHLTVVIPAYNEEDRCMEMFNF